MSQLFPLPIYILFQSILSRNIIQYATYFQISNLVGFYSPWLHIHFMSIDVRDSKQVGFNYHFETISLAHQLLTKENTYVYFQQREIW